MKKHTRPSHDSSEESDDGHQQKKGGSKNAPNKKVVNDSSDSEADYRRKNNNSDSESDNKPRAASTANRTAVSDGADEDNKEIFIKSLSYDVDDDALSTIFGKYGTMTKCKLVQQNGRSRGIAFVEYENASSARKAIEGENGSSH